MCQETPFRANVRRSTKNTVTTEPGPVAAVINFKMPLDMFSLFVTPTLITKITDDTNQKIEKIKDRYSSEYDVTATNTSEVLAVLEISVVSEAQQSSGHDISDFLSQML